MKIAFAGNPNSGKTTMYNALTGKNERVGNWAGVTVEKKEGHIKKCYRNGEEELLAIDLPGAYSMSPYTSEESVTSSYIKNENPDVIINIVDATNLSRSLFFTTQLLELGIPMVVALNKSDVNEKKETKIDIHSLSKRLNCPVVETSSINHSGNGLEELMKQVHSQRGKVQIAPYKQEKTDISSREAVEAADRRRFAFVKGIVNAVETRKVFTKDKNFQDKIDRVITKPATGLPIFVVVMFLVFQISQAWLGPFLADTFTGWLTLFQEWVRGQVSGAADIWQSLLVDGMIGGVIAVIGFLPLVMVMYFLIALLEDCGYMARATVVLDPIFKKVGLSGKSVIPFVVGTGCAIPGVMACRTIHNERERKATAMLAPFMPCGAKLPVIALFSGAFFGNASWVGTLMYFVGILIILVCAVLVNKITGNKNKKSFFIIELPEYKIPSFKRAAMSMLNRGWSYIVKAGTVILLCNTIVQIMQSFNWSFEIIPEGAENTSILATIAEPVAYILIPVVGIKAWQLGAAAITGFIAKENVVGTLAVCYGISNLINTEELTLVEGAGDGVAAAFGITKAAALAYLMFNLFSPPCFAAIGAMNSELKSGKWLFAGICLQLFVGFTIGFGVYQAGTLIATGSVGVGFVSGMITVLVMAGIIAALIAKSSKRSGGEHSVGVSA